MKWYKQKREYQKRNKDWKAARLALANSPEVLADKEIIKQWRLEDEASPVNLSVPKEKI